MSYGYLTISPASHLTVNSWSISERLMAFIAHRNQYAHPFNWTSKSVGKVMAKCELKLAA